LFPVFCPNDQNVTTVEDDVPEEDDTFHKFWSLHKTVPLFLALILGPISSGRSPTFFAKFNSLGMYNKLGKYAYCFDD